MTKQELIKQLDILLEEVKVDEANAKNRVEEAYCVGKQTGLLWARYYLLNLEE